MPYTMLDGIAGRPKEFVGSGTLPTPADLRVRDLAYDIISGITYEYDGTSPIAVGGWGVTRTSSVGHVTEDGWVFTGGTTGVPKILYDLADDTTALSAPGAPTLASIQSKTYTAGENVTKLVLNFHQNATVAVGIHTGVYVAINAASNGVTELTDGGQRYWVQSGVPRTLKFSVPITSVHVVAMCAVANQLDIEPF